MILSDKYNWNSVQQLPSKLYTCGYCGNPLASEKGYLAVSQKNFNNIGQKKIFK